MSTAKKMKTAEEREDIQDENEVKPTTIEELKVRISKNRLPEDQSYGLIYENRVRDTLTRNPRIKSIRVHLIRVRKREEHVYHPPRYPIEPFIPRRASENLMDLPGINYNCFHYQPFDLNEFLKIGQTWKRRRCLICKVQLPIKWWQSFFINDYILDTLNEAELLMKTLNRHDQRIVAVDLSLGDVIPNQLTHEKIVKRVIEEGQSRAFMYKLLIEKGCDLSQLQKHPKRYVIKSFVWEDIPSTVEGHSQLLTIPNQDSQEHTI
jgi:hypothetical protein